MKIGPLEIIVILIAAFAAGLLFRVFRGDRSLDDRGANNSVAAGTSQEIVKGTTNPVRKAGVLLIVLGAIVLLGGMSILDFAMKMFLGAFILVGAGLVALMLSRHR